MAPTVAHGRAFVLCTAADKHGARPFCRPGAPYTALSGRDVTCAIRPQITPHACSPMW
jgi:hypothetical protein